MTARGQSARVAASVVVAAVCWAGSPATGNAERVDRSGAGAAQQDGSAPGRTASGGRSADVGGPGPIRSGRADSRAEGAIGSGGRTGRLPVSDTRDDSAGPGDSGPSGGLVGLGETSAAAAAAEQGFTVRIVARDGEWFPMTKDYREDRINIVIENGTVVRAFVG